MKQYLEALDDIMKNGVEREGRNGITRALFTKQLRFDMTDGFPAVTTKKLYFDLVKGELLWFLEGAHKEVDGEGRADDNRLKEIIGKNKTIWTDNAQADYWTPKAKFDGDLGRVYGIQWREWTNKDGVVTDQLAEAVEKIKNNPHNRRIIVSAWNPGELDDMALPPCHMLFQFFVADGKLSLHMFQRSCDMFLGVPFNIASYALLLHMMAHVTDLQPEEFVITLGDAHIYKIHYDQVKEQLTRTPKKLPDLWLNPEIDDIDDFSMDDIKLENYKHDDPIKAKMAV